MAVQQLFYETAVPVSFNRHKNYSVKTGDTYSFARKVNSVPVTAIEFALAAAEYPVVFAECGAIRLSSHKTRRQKTSFFTSTSGSKE